LIFDFNRRAHARVHKVHSTQAVTDGRPSPDIYRRTEEPSYFYVNLCEVMSLYPVGVKGKRQFIDNNWSLISYRLRKMVGEARVELRTQRSYRVYY